MRKISLSLFFSLFLNSLFFLSAQDYPLLIGTSEGLDGLAWDGMRVHLWRGGNVRKIVRTDDYRVILTSEGVFISEDLVSDNIGQDLKEWEARNAGLPVKTIKVFEDGRKSFIKITQEIKDLEADGDTLVIAMKDTIYLSHNRGQTWQDLGTPYVLTNGIKAVAVARMPELVVFVSHSIYGVSYLLPNKGKWVELNTGLEKLETTNNPDEVSDIAVDAEDGRATVYASQSFRGRLYQLDWTRKRWTQIWSDGKGFCPTDSLDVSSDRGKGVSLRFTADGDVLQWSEGSVSQRADIRDFVKNIYQNLNIVPNCLLMSHSGLTINLSELWMVNNVMNPRQELAVGKKGLYLLIDKAVQDADFKQYLDIIDRAGLNLVVIDMKDDFGRLRWRTDNPALTAKGRVFNPIDIDGFLSAMKTRGVYTVARIVAFKDPELAQQDGGKFAVWDAETGKPWRGYFETKTEGGDVKRSISSEQWVDPYSETVWDYNTMVARELQDRGFDEIQFDYIRFPTDGDNLYQARYRWRDPGMDKDSAILSFLRHVRARVSAPISIDIYGANGWYRTGSRTGQEVELLAPYVDVICPMYYPSHFEQFFLAQSPAELRPYRIYFIGTGRNMVIARRQAVIRPWAQAFYLNVSYDRKFYNRDYVRRQVEGVNDAGAPGYTFWNTSGRYEDIL
ncbi:MAG: hypothetical protein LBH75_02190 [Treponema sp.]|jgi:hypothetical protein|nr:hypothetical protein [Treponema sp.]